MKLESTTLLKTVQYTEKRKVLNYIAFIKFIAMILIIKGHLMSLPRNPIDYGARMCEILFVSSGFLVGYNYYQREMNCNYEESFKYIYKRLKTFYPLLFINTIYGYFITAKKKYDTKEIILLLSILFLVKSWSRFCSHATFYNGHSWFLCSLLFSYFLVPLLLQGLNNKKLTLNLFLIISIFRIIPEEFISHGAFNMFDADFHRGPIIRLFEFYMGMLLIPSFFRSKLYLDKYKKKFWFKILFTFIEFTIIILIYIIMYKFNKVLLRCYFVLIICVFIFIAGYDYGFLSNIFSNKIFVEIMSCQMEMYIIQRTVNISFYIFVNKKQFSSIFHPEIQFYIKLIMIFICGYLYSKLLKKKFIIFFDKIIFLSKSILY